MNQPINPHPASFRDPSGFIYEQSGSVYRFVSTVYEKHYHHLKTTGLDQQFIKLGWLLPFEELNENHTERSDWLCTLKPQHIPFLNYAWEWSFLQLKDAALTTLSICKKALEKGMILKDATHLNIQFVKGKPRWIDHLSFETYEPGTPWIAYRQFCECFLNPLLLAAYCKLETHKLLLAYPEGIPASLTAKLLPFRTKLQTSLLLHVHVHARLGKKGKQPTQKKRPILSQKSLSQIFESLETLIKSLEFSSSIAVWENYYEETILSHAYLEEKKKIVSELLNKTEYKTVLDLGANEGEFSLLCNNEAFVLAADSDPVCISQLYNKLKAAKKHNILPLVLDIMHPSPASGWMNEEHLSFLKRSRTDLCLVLALIHHLVIGKNVTFQQVAALMAKLGPGLIIEFVPKDDPKVKEMLQSRTDIFSHYTIENFEKAFLQQFNIIEKKESTHSSRTLYLMQRK